MVTSFCQLDITKSHPGSKNVHWGITSIIFAYWYVYGTFSWLITTYFQDHVPYISHWNINSHLEDLPLYVAHSFSLQLPTYLFCSVCSVIWPWCDMGVSLPVLFDILVCPLCLDEHLFRLGDFSLLLKNICIFYWKYFVCLQWGILPHSWIENMWPLAFWRGLHIVTGACLWPQDLGSMWYRYMMGKVS